VSLTPLELENLRLRLAFRGYHRDDVERFRSDALRAVEDYIAKLEQAQARIAALEAELSKYHGSEELLKSSVVLAQRTADELIAAAHQRADAIEHEARAGGEEVRRRIAELHSEREHFEYSFYGLLAGFMRRLEHGNPQLAAPSPPPVTAALQPPPPLIAVPSAAPVGQSAGLPTATASVPQAPAPAPLLAEMLSERFQAPPTPPPGPRQVVPPTAPIERDADAAQFDALLAAVQAPPPAPWPPAESQPAPAPAPEPATPSGPAATATEDTSARTDNTDQ
jgi:hypothetical protein